MHSGSLYYGLGLRRALKPCACGAPLSGCGARPPALSMPKATTPEWQALNSACSRRTRLGPSPSDKLNPDFHSFAAQTRSFPSTRSAQCGRPSPERGLRHAETRYALQSRGRPDTSFHHKVQDRHCHSEPACYKVGGSIKDSYLRDEVDPAGLRTSHLVSDGCAVYGWKLKCRQNSCL